MNVITPGLSCNIKLSRLQCLGILQKRNTCIWSSSKIRSTFISYFKNKDHSVIPSSPVVPWNDTSLEFVNAGMNQFKTTLLGLQSSPAARIVNSQKCIRVGGKHNDLSSVGRDTYHHTFFEMLGNWSFNDYFKREACEMSWELLTNVFKIPQSHLYVTYFGGDRDLNIKADEEVKHIWRSLGIPENRILPCGAKDNFWEMGPTGPCGPCTEIHYERVPSENGASKVNMGCEDVIEIWNIVFIQYQRLMNGNLESLGSQFVDTGMGLERMAACLNGCSSNYDTDLFTPLFDVMHKMSGKAPYGGEFEADGMRLDTAYRIVADHSRMVAFSLADGLLPHDSYALRRAIRRCLLLGWDVFGLEPNKNFLSRVIETVTENMSDVYPELARRVERSKSLLEYEDERLRENRSLVSSEWPKLLEKCPQLRNLSCDITPKFIEAMKYLLPILSSNSSNTFPMQEAYVLKEKYSLSHETVEDVAESLGFTLNSDSLSHVNIIQNPNTPNPYDELKNITKRLTQNGVPKTDGSSKYKYHFTKKGYVYDRLQTNVNAIIVDGILKNEIKETENAILVLESSNFYPKSGGQSSDKGFIENEKGVFKVSKVDLVDGYVLHHGHVQSGSLGTKKPVTSKVNKALRLGASKSHSVHHLFMAALRRTSGMAYQRISTVTDRGFTLDVFTHPHLELSHVTSAESIVRKWVKQDQPISSTTLPIFEALRSHQPELVSGEVYPDVVRVVSTEYAGQDDEDKSPLKSIELCCGTHLFNTSHIGDFALTELKPNSNGVTRISAVHGRVASKLIERGGELLVEFSKWDQKITSAIKNNERLTELNKEFKKWKRGIQKSSCPITVFEEIEQKANSLIKQMENVVIQQSNWRELQQEFNTFLRENPNEPVVYKTTTDYRGPMENLVEIIKTVGERPSAFCCKGWGRVRACVRVPEAMEPYSSSLITIEDDLRSAFPDASVQRPSKDILTFHLLGVKFAQVELIRSNVLGIIKRHLIAEDSSS